MLTILAFHLSQCYVGRRLAVGFLDLARKRHLEHIARELLAQATEGESPIEVVVDHGTHDASEIIQLTVRASEGLCNESGNKGTLALRLQNPPRHGTMPIAGGPTCTFLRSTGKHTQRTSSRAELIEYGGKFVSHTAEINKVTNSGEVKEMCRQHKLNEYNLDT